MGDILRGCTDRCFEITLPIAGEAKYAPLHIVIFFSNTQIRLNTRSFAEWHTCRRALDFLLYAADSKPGGSSLPPSKALLE